MLLTLIQKEIMHHILSVRFVALLLMCVLLVPLTLFINYQNYRQNQIDYQEAVKRANAEAKENPPDGIDPDKEVSKLFLKPTPLSVFANGLEEALPTYLGMTRNGVKQSSTGLTQARLSFALGNLDFLFVVSTVFSLLALLFTFDTVAGERETGTIRITLANSLPRDRFLLGKMIGGYLVFVVPFLVSFLFGLLLLVWKGFPLGEPGIFPRVMTLTFASLLYIAVFFGIGTVISTYLDNAKTALIVAFTVWVFAVLIVPRIGFLGAKIIAPARTEQSVYMEKTLLRNDLLKEKQQKFNNKLFEIFGGGSFSVTENIKEKMDELRAPLEEEYRQKFQDQVGKIDREYQRQQNRQERMGEMFSRITPTSSLIYLAMNLSQTGKLKRNTYFDTGNRYYDQLDEEYFKDVSDDALAMATNLSDRMTARMNPFAESSNQETEKISTAPDLIEPALSDTLRHSMLDTLLLCVFAAGLTTVAFLKFFRLDI